MALCRVCCATALCNLVMQGRYWIINPIDGLEGFENLRQYGISLALLDDGEVASQSVTFHDCQCSYCTMLSS